MADDAVELWKKRFSAVFPGLLTKLQETPLSFENGQETQGLGNMVYVGGAPRLRERLAVSDVCSVVGAVAARWRSRSSGVGARVFYAWYDDQAGQLRMSMVAGDLQSGLPFTATLKLVADPEPVARQYLQGDDLVDCDELELAGPGEVSPPDERPDDIVVFAEEFAAP